MKAPTLLETLIRLHTERGKSITDRDIDRITTFYSMPFTTEMLVGEKAIFAGWFDREIETDFDYFEKDGCSKIGKPADCDGEMVVTFDSFVIGEYGGKKYANWYVGENFGLEGERFDFLVPTTLDQFISDCNRAGIPLTFTPYGEKLWRGQQ